MHGVGRYQWSDGVVYEVILFMMSGHFGVNQFGDR